MFGVFPLSPAYGRDYKTVREVTTAFYNGVDFKTASGQYCSIRDFRDLTSVPIRFNKMNQVTAVPIPKA